jgi:hypothetical protein
MRAQHASLFGRGEMGAIAGLVKVLPRTLCLHSDGRRQAIAVPNLVRMSTGFDLVNHLDRGPHPILRLSLQLRLHTYTRRRGHGSGNPERDSKECGRVESRLVAFHAFLTLSFPLASFCICRSEGNADFRSRRKVAPSQER